MKRKIELSDVWDEMPSVTKQLDVNAICPFCGVATNPEIPGGFYSVLDEPEEVRIIIVCACPNCGLLFHKSFITTVLGLRVTDTLEYQGTYPPALAQSNFSDMLNDVSPKFCEIFNQAQHAESVGLTQIAGLGYRKAIEFLIKDYLVHKFPADKSNILKEFVGNSINRIPDQRIKVLAERAVWIGNDETHYERRHESLDIEDMKHFIGALLSYVESELTFEEALTIPKK